MWLSIATFVIVALLSAKQAHARIAQVIEGQSIQASADSLLPGDTVIVSPGNYSETIVLYGKDLTIAGEWLLTGDTTSIRQTIIHPGHNRLDTTSCLVYAYGETESGLLAGITLRAGSGTIWDGESTMAGGGLYIQNSSLTVRNCIFDSCTAGFGGGIFVGASSQHPSSIVTLDSCIVNACSAGNEGGGFSAVRSMLAINDCVFQENQSVSYGAGLIAQFSELTIQNSTFEENSGANGGAFIASSIGTISESRFFNNTSSSASASALTIGHCCVDVVSCQFGSDRPVGLVVSMCCSNEDTINFTGNSIQSMQGDLRPIVALGGTSGEISYNLFQNNYGFRSGAIYGFQNTRARIHHNVFSGNSIIAGSVLVTGPDYSGQFYENLIEGNIGPCVRDAVDPQDSIDVRNNWWGHETGPYHASLNPGGLGDTLGYDQAVFEPFLITPPDTSSSSDSQNRSEILSTWRLLSLYPNPFNNEFRMDIAGFTRDDFTVTLYDLLGRRVTLLHSGSLSGGAVHFAAPPTLSSGVYFVKATDRIQTETKKVVLLK